MIKEQNQIFHLATEHTSYVFRVTESGHLEHLHYGRRITNPNNALFEKHTFAPGNTNDIGRKEFSLEDIRLEMSSYGKGDIREPFVEVVYEDGSMTSDFRFAHAQITEGKEPFETLPGSYDENNKAEHLCVTLKEAYHDLYLELHYYVYEDCDVISRSAKLCNRGTEGVWLHRLMSLQLDFDTPDYVFTTFHGAWAREMNRRSMRLLAGKQVNSSYTGTTSSRANSFVMLGKEHTTEEHGDAYGFHLIYSGNHYEAAEVSSFGKTRLVTGINPQSFCFLLEGKASFEAPEAVMTYSDEGYQGMSLQLHEFIREHIVRGSWKKKVRPVLLNSWEAAYFDINEKKLLSLAKAGKELGVELFVMDDGWFGSRDDDKQSLGDWEVNQKKLPNGLSGLAKKIKDLGLLFGIWVEPEMVNVRSELYRKHPDWTIDIPKQEHAEGRNQRILDLTRTEVQDFIIEKMTEVFSAAEISYVKWDMNRTFSDYFSKALPPERQGEVAHRYVMGFYRCLRELTNRFPDILFEGCAAGGNRFDLGMLCYFPQIWASDDTDAFCRAEIQNGYSYGYPMSVVSAHVSSCPNHQTLRSTPLETRFQVAAFGVCGYECNFCDMKKEELEAVKEQISLYKQWREVLQFGDFYRGRSFNGFETPYANALCNGIGNTMEWTCVSKDRRKAVGFLMQRSVAPNTQFEYYKAKGLCKNYNYRFYNRRLRFDVRDFGDLVNTVSPVHIKKDSLVQHIAAKFVRLESEQEEYEVYGDALMYSGVRLKQGFGGTGYNEEVRFYQDFASRMYFMEALDDTIQQ